MILAPNRKAAQKMLDICESFAVKNNVVFSTNADPRKSKRKALSITGHKHSPAKVPSPLFLCKKELPWVDRCAHLEHMLTTDGQMSQDCREKRASFIDESVKIREMFSFAHPNEIVTAIEKCCYSWYGSSICRIQLFTRSTISSVNKRTYISSKQTS